MASLLSLASCSYTFANASSTNIEGYLPDFLTLNFGPNLRVSAFRRLRVSRDPNATSTMTMGAADNAIF